jgi:hypothetical protein
VKDFFEDETARRQELDDPRARKVSVLEGHEADGEDDIGDFDPEADGNLEDELDQKS